MQTILEDLAVGVVDILVHLAVGLVDMLVVDSSFLLAIPVELVQSSSIWLQDSLAQLKCQTSGMFCTP